MASQVNSTKAIAANPAHRSKAGFKVPVITAFRHVGHLKSMCASSLRHLLVIFQVPSHESFKSILGKQALRKMEADKARGAGYEDFLNEL